MKVATWNVNECIKSTCDIENLKDNTNVIDYNNVDEIIDKINENDFDVVCFQEFPILVDCDELLINRIINETKLKNYIVKDTANSYLFKGGRIGVAIFSKYKIEEEFITLFNNPNLTKVSSSGKTYYSFDKAKIKAMINGYVVITGHAISFAPFGCTEWDYPESYKPLEDLIDKYKNNKLIVLGDFNCDKIFELIPSIKDKVIDSIEMPTTKAYYENIGEIQMDYILISKGINVSNKEKIDNFSDHYIVSEEIN